MRKGREEKWGEEHCHSLPCPHVMHFKPPPPLPPPPRRSPPSQFFLKSDGIIKIYITVDKDQKSSREIKTELAQYITNFQNTWDKKKSLIHSFDLKRKDIQDVLAYLFIIQKRNIIKKIQKENTRIK